jgi:hypothetical protein
MNLEDLIMIFILLNFKGRLYEVIVNYFSETVKQ